MGAHQHRACSRRHRAVRSRPRALGRPSRPRRFHSELLRSEHVAPAAHGLGYPAQPESVRAAPAQECDERVWRECGESVAREWRECGEGVARAFGCEWAYRVHACSRIASCSRTAIREKISSYCIGSTPASAQALSRSSCAVAVGAVSSTWR